MSRPANTRRTAVPALLQWTAPGRCLVLLLAATSITCLLSEMYGLCDMRSFFHLILIPATAALYTLAAADRLLGDRRLWRAVMIGTLAGLFGAVAYDVFRLPFVYSDAWGMGRIGIPQMPLFKVFPRFGAMILGEALEQPRYSTAAHLLGWAYHFSNGATFGVMFAALFGGGAQMQAGNGRSKCIDPQRHRADEDDRRRRFDPARRAIIWAVLMAVGIELCMLASPYAQYFNISLTPRFVVVTLLAHVVFGLGLGAWYAVHDRRWSVRT